MKKGKLALIVISGLIGISVIANMFGDSSNKTNNNANSKKQENESAKVEQKIEKTEEELKKEEEQKKREEEQKLEEKKKLEEKNKINTAIGAATAAATITNKNNNREEVRQERPVEEKKGTDTDRGQAKVATRAVQSVQQKVNSNGREVYITPSGKKYHYDPQCGGKNSYKVGINSVGGRTPCKKCVH